MSCIKSPIQWSDQTMRILRRWIILFGIFQVIGLYFFINGFTVCLFLTYLFFVADAIALRLQMGKTTYDDPPIKSSGMNNETEINKEILTLLVKIQTKAPELSKYLGEMPVVLKNGGSKVNLQNLKDYYDSLQNLLKNYLLEQETNPK